MTQTNDRIAALMAAREPWLTDGGLETTLIFHNGRDLPAFAAFPLIETEEGRAELDDYYQGYYEIARKAGTGFVLDVPTWRANPGWGEAVGYDRAALDRVNRLGARHACTVRDAWEADGSPIIVNGVIGPSDDGYSASHHLTAAMAEAVHSPQIAALVAGGVEMVTAVTMTYVEEALGVARAAKAVGVPCVIAFTTETDGRLPSGQGLADAIRAVDDDPATDVLYFMVNCAHPDHFAGTVAEGDDWRYRIGGVRANASRMSHAELDEAEDLDAGDPHEFGTLNADLGAVLPNLRVVGGCCGTDTRHIHAVSGCIHHRRAA